CTWYYGSSYGTDYW
nr:immunoglobulin heavy chain junction region [Mus musculus]